jgi:fructosamine-3-kinase
MHVRVVSREPVAGGDINEAFRATLDDGSCVFIKQHAHAPAGMFAAEADGLQWLAEGPLRVPRVLEVAADHLVLEWLDLVGRPDARAFGAGLAALHALGAPQFGLPRDNFLATLPQDNTAEPDWPAFYVGLDRQLDQLRVASVWGPPEPPARLHGDLWWGNVAATREEPVILDPAVYGGHREVDLAMLALFGGLPEALVRGYDEVAPLADGWRDRIALHQLYPLAAHACLFGGGYGAQVAATLRRYLG